MAQVHQKTWIMAKNQHVQLRGHSFAACSSGLNSSVSPHSFVVTNHQQARSSLHSDRGQMADVPTGDRSNFRGRLQNKTTTSITFLKGTNAGIVAAELGIGAIEFPPTITSMLPSPSASVMWDSLGHGKLRSVRQHLRYETFLPLVPEKECAQTYWHAAHRPVAVLPV